LNCFKKESNDNERSDKEENDNGFESPFVTIGRLVDFHICEDGGRLYTIQWESRRKKFPKSDSESSSESMSESTMSLGYNICTELWTESRVRIGISLYQSMGLKVAKYFESGDFIGQVTNVYASGIQNEGEIFYHIQYEDGDSEDFDEKELEEGVALYYRLQKRENRNEPLLNRSFGLKVGKRFETGVFVGQVTNVYASGNQNDGEVFYHIQYEDGDSEDFDENELEEGVSLYCRMQKRETRKRKHSKDKEDRLIKDINHSQRKRATSHSFGALYDKATPIHTLILGTHPAKKSLNENRYFANPSNAFWWIAGDCLGFRRDRGEKMNGGLMKLCADLRYDESSIIPYDKQINILCRHGFALWDIIGSCQRKGSLDCAIKNGKPNDIEDFVEQNPTIKTIVLANGKSSLIFFNRHFSEWFKSGKLILHKAKVTTSRSEVSTSKLNENEIVNAEKTHPITCICALSVSPAASTLTYKEKRDFWDKFVYSPGLKLRQQLATTTKPIPTSCSSSTCDGIILSSTTT
jgi:hypoxanthine-DNA glycosylase